MHGFCNLRYLAHLGAESEQSTQVGKVIQSHVKSTHPMGTPVHGEGDLQVTRHLRLSKNHAHTHTHHHFCHSTKIGNRRPNTNIKSKLLRAACQTSRRVVCILNPRFNRSDFGLFISPHEYQHFMSFHMF